MMRAVSTPNEMPPLRWRMVYREAELYKAAVRLYTKPLFNGRKAFSTSTDDRTLYDFARHGLRHLQALHRALTQERFRFRPGLALHHNFNGKHRTLYVYPWEERLVDLLLYRLLTRRLHAWFSPHAYAYRLNGGGVDCCQRRVAGLLARARGPLYIVKRDIADYFASVNHVCLRVQVRALVAPDDYLSALLESRIRFSYVDDGRPCVAEHGIPFGTAIACLFANVHLTALDRRMAAVPDLRYFRYADDLLAVTPSRAAALEAAAIMADELARLGLSDKPSHTLDLCLAPTPTPAAAAEAPFAPARHFRHLGLDFRAGGGVGLSVDKARKICHLFRYAFRRRRARFRRITDPRRRAALAIALARQVLEEGVRNVAIIDYYLRHVDDEAQLRGLDRWLAEEVLSRAFGGGHRKGHFRRLPFGELRAMGLPSLAHRRRLLRHGHLASSFFIWEQHRKCRRFGGKAARSTASEATAARGAFSSDPEAAAINTL